MARPARNHRQPAPGARSPQTVALEHLARAEALIAAGRLAQAGQQLDPALKGPLAQETSQVEAALDVYRTALAREPG